MQKNKKVVEEEEDGEKKKEGNQRRAARPKITSRTNHDGRLLSFLPV